MRFFERGCMGLTSGRTSRWFAGVPSELTERFMIFKNLYL